MFPSFAMFIDSSESNVSFLRLNVEELQSFERPRKEEKNFEPCHFCFWVDTYQRKKNVISNLVKRTRKRERKMSLHSVAMGFSPSSVHPEKANRTLHEHGPKAFLNWDRTAAATLHTKRFRLRFAISFSETSRRDKHAFRYKVLTKQVSPVPLC